MTNDLLPTFITNLIIHIREGFLWFHLVFPFELSFFLLMDCDIRESSLWFHLVFPFKPSFFLLRDSGNAVQYSLNVYTVVSFSFSLLILFGKSWHATEAMILSPWVWHYDLTWGGCYAYLQLEVFWPHFKCFSIFIYWCCDVTWLGWKVESYL